jgi:thiol-disulfide isomerase/thioredoxin
MAFRSFLVLATCFIANLTGTLSAEDKPLMVGDPAPKLEVREFIKGEPVKQFEKGKVYVVSFWATWCQPCMECIPLLTELQKNNPKVVFLGVSIDEPATDVAAFVKMMGEKMDYRIATDTRVKDATEGQTQKSWLLASLIDEIPVAFIINKEGKVAWVGQPTDAEEPLAQIVAGKWDLAAEIKKNSEIVAAKQRAAALDAKFTATVEAKKYQEALDLLEKALTTDPDLELNWGIAKFWCQMLLHQTDAAIKYGNHIVDEVYQEDPVQLILIAGLIVRPEEFAPFGGPHDKAGADQTKPKSTGTIKETEPTKAEENAPAKKTDAKESQPEAKEAPSKIDPKLLELAIRAGEQAAELTVNFPDVTQRTTIIEILASAYMAGGAKDKATTVLQTELEALQAHSAVIKAAMLLIKSQLKDLGKTSDDKQAQATEESKKENPEEKKPNSDK